MKVKMSENMIGTGVCPVCNSPKARFTVSKKQLACMACNTCNSQIFARSDFSDEKLRACIRTAPATPTPAPAPKALALEPIKPPVVVVTSEKKGFGMLGAWL